MVNEGIISGKLTPAESVANMLLSKNPVFVKRGQGAIKAGGPAFEEMVNEAINRMTKSAQ